MPKAMLRKGRCRTAHRGAFASRQHLHSDKALRKANTSARSESLICQRGMSAFTSSEAMLTGESTAVTKTSGGKVIGGPINGKGSLTIEVKGTGNDRCLTSGRTRLRARQAGFGDQSFRSRCVRRRTDNPRRSRVSYSLIGDWAVQWAPLKARQKGEPA